MAEWLIATVLKTVLPQGNEGSNPSCSGSLTGVDRRFFLLPKCTFCIGLCLWSEPLFLSLPTSFFYHASSAYEKFNIVLRAEIFYFHIPGVGVAACQLATSLA